MVTIFPGAVMIDASNQALYSLNANINSPKRVLYVLYDLRLERADKGFFQLRKDSSSPIYWLSNFEFISYCF